MSWRSASNAPSLSTAMDQQRMASDEPATYTFAQAWLNWKLWARTAFSVWSAGSPAPTVCGMSAAFSRPSAMAANTMATAENAYTMSSTARNAPAANSAAANGGKRMGSSVQGDGPARLFAQVRSAAGLAVVMFDDSDRRGCLRGGRFGLKWVHRLQRHGLAYANTRCFSRDSECTAAWGNERSSAHLKRQPREAYSRNASAGATRQLSTESASRSRPFLVAYNNVL